MDALSSLTVDWLIPRVLVGVLGGYVLRVMEHIVWASKSPPEENPLGNFRFALMILPQSALVGLSLGCLLLALVAMFFRNLIIVEVSAYLLPALMSFLAVDLRENAQENLANIAVVTASDRMEIYENRLCYSVQSGNKSSR